MRIGWGLAAKIGDRLGKKNHCRFLTAIVVVLAIFAPFSTPELRSGDTPRKRGPVVLSPGTEFRGTFHPELRSGVHFTWNSVPGYIII